MFFVRLRILSRKNKQVFLDVIQMMEKEASHGVDVPL